MFRLSYLNFYVISVQLIYKFIPQRLMNRHFTRIILLLKHVFFPHLSHTAPLGSGLVIRTNIYLWFVSNIHSYRMNMVGKLATSRSNYRITVFNAFFLLMYLKYRKKKLQTQSNDFVIIVGMFSWLKNNNVE